MLFGTEKWFFFTIFNGSVDNFFDQGGQSCTLVWMPSLKFKSWLESRWGISSLEISLLSCQSWSWSFDCWFWNSPLPNVQKRYAILDCQKFLGSRMGWTGLLQAKSLWRSPAGVDFLSNRNWDLGWIWAEWPTFLPL